MRRAYILDEANKKFMQTYCGETLVYLMTMKTIANNDII
jgi:hypothetical protein